jgi:hypothetical protein
MASVGMLFQPAETTLALLLLLLCRSRRCYQLPRTFTPQSRQCQFGCQGSPAHAIHLTSYFSQLNCNYVAAAAAAL